MAPENTVTPWRALAVAVCWYVAAALAGVPFVLLENAGRLPPSMGAALTALVVPAVLLWPTLRAGLARALLHPPMGRPVRVGLVFVLVLIANKAMLALLPVPVAEMAPTGLNFWVVVRSAAIALAAPVAEELFFRGWLWARLSRSWSPNVVATVTGVAFALAHAQYAASVLPITVALSWLRLRDDSLRAPLALHLAMNVFAVAVTLSR